MLGIALPKAGAVNMGGAAKVVGGKNGGNFVGGYDGGYTVGRVGGYIVG